MLDALDASIQQVNDGVALLASSAVSRDHWALLQAAKPALVKALAAYADVTEAWRNMLSLSLELEYSWAADYIAKVRTT